MLRALAFCLALTLAVPTLARAGEIGAPQDALVQRFFQQLQAGEIGPAYDKLFAGTLLVERKQAEVAMLNAQTASAMSLYGKVNGWELMSADNMSASYGQAIYLLRTDNAPLFFKFDFYKAKDRWVVVRIFFNDTYSALPK
jgi:hypothetical protein